MENRLIRKNRDIKLKNKNPWYKDGDYIQLLVLAAIPALIIFIWCYIPMFGIIIAFKNYKYNLGILKSPWIGFKNFENLVSSNVFSKLVFNTIGNNFLFIVFGTIAAIIIAILLFEVRSRVATKVYQTIMITPHFISMVLVSFLVYIFLSPSGGLINVLLNRLGMESVDWYATPKAWPVILTITYIWKHFGMDSVMYYAALMGVDDAVIEAARIDGANKFRVYLHVILPELTGLIVMLVILKIGNIFRADFGMFYQVTRNAGTLYDTTDVMDTYIFRMVREIGDMGLSSAADVLQSMVGFVLVVITNRITKKIDPDKALF